MTRLMLLLFAGVLCSCERQKQLPVVTVKQGTLRGSKEYLLNGRHTYYSFKGIPFAAPPIGEFRFQAPQPPKRWSGVRNATEHGPVCPQLNLANQFTGSEDCLYLNVYSKNLATKSAVMVFIFGGGYTSGSGNTDMYGPEFLIEHDVVLVTLNYRLKMLGFLSLDTPEVPGNAGIKDQVAALRWVKENIQQFGGDPDRVTIFGESAGAVAVTLHMLSPMSRGLFHGAIAQSGVALQTLGIARDAKEKTIRAAKLLGEDSTNTDELLHFFKTVPAENLTRLTLEPRTEDEIYRYQPLSFVPNIEKRFDNVEAILTEEPIDLLRAKKVNAVPLLIGYNSAEGILMISDQLNKSDYLNAHPSFLVPWDISQKVPEIKLPEIGERIKDFYMGGKNLSLDTANIIVDMQTDVQFSYPTFVFNQLYSEMNEPIYMYRFEFETELNYFKIALGWGGLEGACHADDIYYLFYNDFNKDIYRSREELRQYVRTVGRIWTNFAKTGNPTPSEGSFPTWQRYTNARKEYVALSETPANKLYADRARIQFVNQLYCEAGLPCLTA